MNTGENEQGLRKIMDMTRLMAIALLMLHFYYVCYQAFADWGYRSLITDRLLGNLARTGLFYPFEKAKLIVLSLLLISLIGVKGKKEIKISRRKVLVYLIVGISFYFLSYWTFYAHLRVKEKTVIYIGLTSFGFILTMTGGTLFSRIIQRHLSSDIFNKLSETFPQEERLLENEYSINLAAII